MAMNNVTRVENLQSCESLQKLDLTMNFVPASALPSLATLAPLYNLRELYLLGNPCQRWQHYRQFVVAWLPQLTRLVRHSLAALVHLLTQSCCIVNISNRQ